MTLNVIAAVPPSPEIGAALPIGGPLGILGSLATIGLTVVVLWLLLVERDAPGGWAGGYDRAMAPAHQARAPSAGP